jgi:transforming growth factor-beta-induced protein
MINNNFTQEKTMNKLVLSLMVVFALALGACAPQAAPAPQATQQPAPAATEEPTAMPEPTEAPQTIVDIAVANGSFNTLVAAVQAAGLVDTLTSDGPFTVFAPTDEAFAKLPAGTLDELLANPEQLKDILLYHVVPGKVMAADVLTLDGKSADTALEGKQIAIAIDGDKVILNESANVVATDVAASNGVIHVIDSVILPPADEAMAEMDIVDTAVANGSFTTLVAAVQAAGLVDTLKGEGPFTVFAPTDEAFAKLPAGTLDQLLANPDELKNILLYHVVPGKVMAADVVGLDGQSADTALEGKQIAVKIDGDKVLLNDSAAVVSTDVAASNGVIHVIDSVILPPADEMMADKDIIDTAVADGRFTTLAAAIEAAGLVETLKGEGPFTVFAPTDDAFAKLPAGTVEALLQDIPQLTNILLYHVVPGKVMAADVVGLNGQSADTALDGAQIAITVDGDKVMLNENVMVIITDIATTNGVIHVIDAVLLPPTE